MTGGVASTYACANCCPNVIDGVYVNPTFLATEISSVTQFTATQTEQNCYFQQFGPYQAYPDQWNSFNSGVATIDYTGNFEAVGVGDTNIEGCVERTIWYNWGGGYCEPVSDLMCDAAPTEVKPRVEILRNGQVIASTSSTSVTQNVVAGEKIELTTRVTGGTGTSQWTITGDKAIKNYIVTFSNGRAVKAEKIDLETSDLNQSSADFYWIDEGNPLEAKYTITINSAPHSATAKFNVKKPTSTLTTTTSNVSLGTVVISENPNESIFGLHYGEPLATPGIRFEASVSLPSGVTGQVVWAQIVNTERKRTPTGGSQQTIKGIGLDGEFPDLPNSATNEDSPLLGAGPPCANTFISAFDNFTTWILFKPSVTNVTTIYVPLKKVSWSWSGTASRGADCNSWTLTNSSRTQNPTGVSTTDYPEWSAIVQDFQWQ